MDNLKWFKFSPSHWFMGRIQRCSEVSQARFMRLCCIYWTNECIMCVEDAEIEMGVEEFKELIRLKIIEHDADGSIGIKFLDEQYEDCTDISKSRSKAAKARWGNPKAKQGNANAMQMHASAMQSNADKTREEENRIEKTTLDLSEPDLFETFWQLYGKGTSRVAAQKEWFNIDEPEYTKIIAHVPKYVESTPDLKFRKDAVNYLKNRAWLDADLPKTESTIKPKLETHQMTREQKIQYCADNGIRNGSASFNRIVNNLSF